MAVNTQQWFALLKRFAVTKKRHRSIAPTSFPHLTSSSYLLGSALEKRAVISQWFLHLEGRGCQAPASLPPHSFLSLLPPPQPCNPSTSSFLPFLPQASLFKFPCCQPTLAKRHSLPVSWLNCWRCLHLLGNPLSLFVPSTETHLHNSLCKPEIPFSLFFFIFFCFSLSLL